MTDRTDPLADFLESRVEAETPVTLTGFDDVRRRAGRLRLRVVAGVAASVLLVAGLGVAGWAARGGQDGATGPAQSPSSTTSRPATSYDVDLPASGIVAVLPGRELPLPANDRCWGDRECVRVLMRDQTGPDLGSPEGVDFRFERPGWDFTATFVPLGASCPRGTTVAAQQRGDGLFHLDPAGPAGTYQVDLAGTGDGGFVSTRFVWTTASDGAVEPALGQVQVVPQPGTGPGHALEVLFTDLPFQPARSEVSPQATVEVTAADGHRTEVAVPLAVASLTCREQGTFYFQGEVPASVGAPGPAPWDLVVTVTIRGTRHTGTGRWPGPGPVPGEATFETLTWQPALPR